MEYDELKSMWEQYNSKLDNLEKLNKKIILDNLSKRPNRKINWHKFQSLYGLIAVPVILAVALHPSFLNASLNWKFIIGCILMASVVIFVSVLNYKSYMIIKDVNLSKDSIIDSAKKIVDFKETFNLRWKSAFIYYPIICAGTILIAWNSFVFNTSTIVFLIVFFIATYMMNIFGPKSYRNRLSRLEKDILELKEYAD